MIPRLPPAYTAETIYENRHAGVFLLPNARTLLCQTRKSYLPHGVFVETYQQIEQLVALHGITRLIFDKQSLTVFNQTSMIWYHIEWKQKMLAMGLSTYRKILPADETFRMAVSICRENLLKENPGFDLSAFDIRYCDSVNEALEK